MGEITARCGEMSGGQIPGLLAPGGSGLSHEEGARCSTGPWGGSALPCPAPVPGSPQPRGHPQLMGWAGRPRAASPSPGAAVPRPLPGRCSSPLVLSHRWWFVSACSGIAVLAVRNAFHMPRLNLPASMASPSLSAFPSPDWEAGWIFSFCSCSPCHVSSGPEKRELWLFCAS